MNYAAHGLRISFGGVEIVLKCREPAFIHRQLNARVMWHLFYLMRSIFFVCKEVFPICSV